MGYKLQRSEWVSPPKLLLFYKQGGVWIAQRLYILQTGVILKNV